MKLPNKETVKHFVQGLLVMLSSSLGFYLLYAIVWCVVGLPQTTLANWITAIAGLLTTKALVVWMVRS